MSTFRPAINGTRVAVTRRALDGYKLTGITYGADRSCTICSGPPSQHEIFESEISKAAAMKILAGLMKVTDESGTGGLSRGEREARFMLGVLIVGAAADSRVGRSGSGGAQRGQKESPELSIVHIRPQPGAVSRWATGRLPEDRCV